MEIEEIFELVLKSEGGFSNHSRDNGGATKHGITLAQFRRWKKSSRASVAQLQAITPAIAKTIYKDFYWLPLKCDKLPPGVAYIVMDAGMMHGIYKAARYLQQAVGTKVDEQVGPKTIEATLSVDDAETITKIHDYRMARVKGHSDYDVFGRGWINRLLRVKKKALEHVRK